MFTLFADFDKMLWLGVALLTLAVIVYLPLFCIFFFAGRMDGPASIRWAWTVGITGFFIWLLWINESYAVYLAFWRGDPRITLSNFFTLFTLALIFLVLIWKRRAEIEKA